MMWLVNISGLLLISGIVWWFWLYKSKDSVTVTGKVVDVVVKDGIYQPSRIKIPVNKATTLRFIRKDASPCAGTVIFSEFDISEELPVDKPKDIVLTPQHPGSFSFNCQMHMYKGELQVEASG